MKKVFAWAALCIAFLLLLSAYDPITHLRVYLENTRSDTPYIQVVRATIAPIAPLAQEGQTDQIRATLYFRYEDTKYLGQEAYVLSVPRDSTLEKVIVSALIDGPDGMHSALSSPFPEGVKVLGTQRDGDTVSVTLNQAFLSLPAQAPDNWQSDAYWAQEVPLRRLLALEAIVLSLTEDARCQSVQLLVSANDADTQGQRVKRALFYPEETDQTLVLEPVTRDESFILTSRAIVTSAMLAWQAKDFETLYRFLGVNNTQQDSTQMPSLGEFIQDATNLSSALLTFNVSTGSVSPEGQRATVVVDLQYSGEEEQRVRLTGIPISLYRENDNWKVSYHDMISLMQRK